MKVVDLFCGAGGFSEGFHRAGFKIVRAYDIWEPALLTHNMNHSNGESVALKGDIYEISRLEDDEFENAIPDSEVIIGSPPCIAFSNSNNSGKADKEDGIKLIKAFLRIVARKKFKKNSKLKYWIMENVGNSEKFVQESYTMEELELENFTDKVLFVKNSTSGLYNMKYYGVPTNRIRYICGDFPDIPTTTEERDIILLGQILNHLGPPLPEEYNKTDELLTDPTYKFNIPRNSITDHHYVSEIPKFEWSKAKRHKIDKGYMGRMAFPENIAKPARTIMATLSRSARESMIFPLENSIERYRVPTIREVATLMSFPIDFRFYGENETVKYRMVGNAVTPKFSYELAKAIRNDYKHSNENPKVEAGVKDKFHIKKTFSKNPSFTDLNGKILPLKVEKEKRENAKYKYHVPYLVQNTFRVELKNVFNENGDLEKWDVAIHRSQGKNAEVFKRIKLSKNVFDNNLIIKVDKFAKEILVKVGKAKELQKNYCKTTLDRKDSLGPDELLYKIKEFLASYQGEPVKIEEIKREVPYQIVLAYYILNKIVEGLNDEEKSFE